MHNSKQFLNIFEYSIVSVLLIISQSAPLLRDDPVDNDWP